MGGDMNPFNAFGNVLTKAPVVTAAIMPLVSIVFMMVGFKHAEMELEIDKLWIPETSDYAKYLQYGDSVAYLNSSTFDFYGISVPRAGGNILTAASLLQVRDRLKATQDRTLTMNGVTVGWQDMCYNPAGAYQLPCFRMHVLDCFEEGAYDFTPVNKMAWESIVRPSFLAQGQADRGNLIAANMDAGWQQAMPMIYDAIVKSAMAATPHIPSMALFGCAASPGSQQPFCTFDGTSVLIASATGTTPGTWEGDANCTACISGLTQYLQNEPGNAAIGMPKGTDILDKMYIGGAEQGLIQPAMPGVTAAVLMATFGTATEKDAVDTFLKNAPAVIGFVTQTVAAEVDAMIPLEVDRMLKDATPYNFRTYGSAVGTSRPRLNSTTGTLLSDAEVLEAVSGTCYAWDGGEFLPSNTNPVLLGLPVPADYNSTKKLTSVEALEYIYTFIAQDFLKERLATRPDMFGGPVNITRQQAVEIVKEWKVQFEEAFAAGWDSSSSSLQHVGYTDEAGTVGSIGRELKDVADGTTSLTLVYIVITVLFAGVIMLSLNLVSSRAVLAMVGAIYAVIACFGAFGLCCATGMKLNVVHLTSMPFIIIGIGVDDMFMLALADKAVEGGGAPENFAKAFGSVAVPVTMTSLVNGAMFAVLALSSDIQAVYLAGITGLYSVVILYATMLLSFASLVYLDIRRRAVDRYDLVCCMKAKVTAARRNSEVTRAVHQGCYKPLVTSLVGRSVILVLALVVIVLGFVGMTQVRLGLDLQDLFPSETASGEFATLRSKLFPVWPVAIGWGELDYQSPVVQLRMASQYEQVAALDMIAAPPGAKFVWTARFAMWGQWNANTSCRSTLVPNVDNLLLKSAGGMCEDDGSGCPVFQNLAEADYAACFNQWMYHGLGMEYNQVSPGIRTDYDTGIMMPIRKSVANAGGIMFGTGLVDTDAYVKIIADTRAIVDNHPSCTLPEDCAMSGTPFSYWEQYLDLVNVIYSLGGWATALAFVISLVFLFLELTLSGRGTVMQRLFSSAIGGLLITFASVASMASVIGFCGLADIQLSIFTAMSALISTGLAVEFSVHVVHRFIEAPEDMKSGAERVDYAMNYLFKPTALAFVTSALGVGMMGLSEFRFVKMYFFAPLMFAVLASYFFGIFALPALLCFMGCCMPALKVKDAEVDPLQNANGVGVAPVEAGKI